MIFIHDRHYPFKKKLSDVLPEMEPSSGLADVIDMSSKDMREGKMRAVDL